MKTRVMGEELVKRNEKILEAIKELGPISSQDLADYIGCSKFVIIDSVRNMRKGEMGIGIMSSREKGYWFDDKQTGFKNHEGYNDPTFKLAMDNLANTMMSNGIKDKALSTVVRKDKVIFEEGRIVRLNAFDSKSFKTFVIVGVSENGHVLKLVPVVDGRIFVFKDGERKICVSDIYTALPQRATEIDTLKVEVFNAALTEGGITKISKHVLSFIKDTINEASKPAVAAKEVETKTITISEAAKPTVSCAKEEKRAFSEMEMALALARQRADIYEKVLFALIGGKPNE